MDRISQATRGGVTGGEVERKVGRGSSGGEGIAAEYVVEVENFEVLIGGSLSIAVFDIGGSSEVSSCKVFWLVDL